jgi:hypothetical protein
MLRFKQFVKESEEVNEDPEIVAEGLSDIVKGVKRKIAGKKDPKEVAHTYARIARRDIEDANKLNNQSAYDARDKSVKRWGKVNKVVNKEGVAEGLDEASAAWQRKEGKNPSGGLNKKGIASYRRENPGSKLSMAVTTKPSKLKKGSKAWNRRKSFCARMGGMPGPMKDEKGRPTRKALSLRKWNC